MSIVNGRATDTCSSSSLLIPENVSIICGSLDLQSAPKNKIEFLSPYREHTNKCAACLARVHALAQRACICVQTRARLFWSLRSLAVHLTSLHTKLHHTTVGASRSTSRQSHPLALLPLILPACRPFSIQRILLLSTKIPPKHKNHFSAKIQNFRSMHYSSAHSFPVL